MKDAGPGPHPIDLHVGLRLRLRRKELRISQEKLAEALGLTFQQVQKYERGANRVSASKLWEIAQVLKAPVGYFYEGWSDPGDPDAPPPSYHPAQRLLMSDEGLELAACFPKIPRAARRQLLELIRTLADEESQSARTAAN
ncbi:MAG: helix-turn-helix transcriptional regulator [Phenylobacterium sp.]